MLTRDQIVERANLVEKASNQMIAHLRGSTALIGQPGKLQELLTNLRRKADLISATMKELRDDRDARATAAAAAEPETPASAAP